MGPAGQRNGERSGGGAKSQQTVFYWREICGCDGGDMGEWEYIYSMSTRSFSVFIALMCFFFCNAYVSWIKTKKYLCLVCTHSHSLFIFMKYAFYLCFYDISFPFFISLAFCEWPIAKFCLKTQWNNHILSSHTVHSDILLIDFNREVLEMLINSVIIIKNVQTMCTK